MTARAPIARSARAALLLAGAALALTACAYIGRAPANRPVPPSARRTLILSETTAPREARVYLVLDANYVYRIEPWDERIVIGPLLVHQQPPLFRRPLFGEGMMVFPGVSGEYRIDSYMPTDAPPTLVKVYREEYDQVELACIRDPGTEPCHQLRHGRTGRRLGLYLAPMAAVVAYLFWTRD